jgi:hypothetical protein
MTATFFYHYWQADIALREYENVGLVLPVAPHWPWATMQAATGNGCLVSRAALAGCLMSGTTWHMNSLTLSSDYPRSTKLRLDRHG